MYRPLVRTDRDGNIVHVRGRSQRSRMRWRLTWNVMLEADYQLLMAFFEQQQGNSFNWTHPVSSTVYECVFSSNSLVSRCAIDAYRSVSVEIEEL